jgi:FkbM family methyltransferase
LSMEQRKEVNDEPLPRRLRKLSRLGLAFDAVLRNWLKRRAAGARDKGFPVLSVIPGDAIGLDVIVEGLYEEAILELLFKDVLRPFESKFTQGIAIDIGANIGNHSLYFSRIFKTVVAFEPNAIAQHILRGNLALNHVANVDIQLVGLSDKSGSARLAMREEANLGSGSVVEAASEGKDVHTIELRRADDVWREQRYSDPVCLIKVDVEGHEINVLSGAENILKDHKPIILFEANGKYGHSGADAVFHFLRELGYSRFYTLAKDSPFPGFKGKLARGVIRMMCGAAYELRERIELDDRFYNCVIATASEKLL